MSAGNLSAAYRHQMRRATTRAMGGDPIVGWKIALTSPGAMKRFGTDEPVFAALHRSMSRPTGEPDRRARPSMVESEIAVRLGAHRPGESVVSRIESLAPALEFVRVIDDGVNLDDFVATGAAAIGVVLGEWHRVDQALLGALATGLHIDLRDGHDRAIACGNSEAVFGGPLSALAWLNDRLESEGLALLDDQIVMTGSFHRPVPVPKGGSIRATYAPIGWTVGADAR